MDIRKWKPTAPFGIVRPIMGSHQIFELGIRPLLTSLPILFHLFAKLMSLLNLLLRHSACSGLWYWD